MRKTKIVCTLGPATDGIITDLIEKGMNVARFNFSHGTHDEHKVRADDVKKTRKVTGMPVALLLDTKGPEIRIRQFEKGKVMLTRGQRFVLTTEDVSGTDQKVSITYKGLPEDISVDSRILLDDGLIELNVKDKNTTEIICEVVNGGEVSNNKGVNLPGTTISLPFISERDKKDILFGVENDFDFIAASFTRSAHDINEIKKLLDEYNGEHIKIIAKIENRDGVDNIDEILRVSDGLMVARGDMGVEIPFEELPAVQKKIIKKCNMAGKPVITATQMLDSMIRNPRPTRAEITDVANAIYDGTSAVMLSGETSIGKYPLDAVETLTKISREAEKDINYIERFQKQHMAISKNVTNAISHATCSTAHLLNAAAIISLTKSGYSARMVSKYRPACPIIAATISEKVYNQLSINWAVYPVMTELKATTDEIFNQSIDVAKKTGLVTNGDLVVLSGGIPVGISGTTNTLKVHVIGDVLIQGEGVNAYKASGNLFVIDDVHHDLKSFTAGDVLVIRRTTEEILSIMKYASAIITEEEKDDSQAVIVARALEIPVLAGVSNATEILKSGIVVTVDAKSGTVYSGVK